MSQLLALREQIAPFESDFAITQKALDFTTTRQMLRRNGHVTLDFITNRQMLRRLVDRHLTVTCNMPLHAIT